MINATFHTAVTLAVFHGAEEKLVLSLASGRIGGLLTSQGFGLCQKRLAQGLTKGHAQLGPDVELAHGSVARQIKSHCCGNATRC